jgi:hypothetical protein
MIAVPPVPTIIEPELAAVLATLPEEAADELTEPTEEPTEELTEPLPPPAPALMAGSSASQSWLHALQSAVTTAVATRKKRGLERGARTRRAAYQQTPDPRSTVRGRRRIETRTSRKRSFSLLFDSPSIVHQGTHGFTLPCKG